MAIEDERIKGLLSTWGLAAKPCDLCKSTAALLYCRHHSAFLCGACDATVHAAVSHDRVWICEVCEQAPASVTCKADAAALCSSCDRDIHSANPLARRHERIPIVPFSHAPPSDPKSSAAFDFVQPPSVEDSDSWLIPNFQSKIGGSDFFYSSEIDSRLDSGSPDHLNASVKHRENEQLFNHRSYVTGAGSESVVPIQAKSSHLNKLCRESCFEIDFTQPKLSPYNFSAQSASSSEVGIVPDGNANSTSEVSNFSFSTSLSGNGNGAVLEGCASTPAVPLSRSDREARVMRYRERRKNRRFEKTIRYASRKAYAESRPRIKGRFARRTASDDDGKVAAEQMYESATNGGGVNRFVFEDELYGVVPSF